MKTIITTLTILTAIIVYAQEHRPEIHCKHFFYGYPYGTPETNDLIIRDIYALSNNDATKFADWVAYRLTMTEISGDLTVERRWKTDPWLDKNETLEPEPDDYEDASSTLKINRGHQAPLASYKGSQYASHTNYLSNITPQKTNLNQGAWYKLENNVRALVENCNTVYVMTGTLYERPMPKLPKCDEPHEVPSGYWKIVCMEKSGVISVAAFIFDQDTPRTDTVIDHLVTVDEVERRSGLDFLWTLEDRQEDLIEGSLNRTFANAHFKK
ncbi:MAG: DNA/RNA non-specific endonuclease [Sinomicrobium sp.]|nr:DNA/RNA non-specific endonuclease [Sinomicrobium sp.]